MLGVAGGGRGWPESVIFATGVEDGIREFALD
jgi:hypothetical protein